MRLLTAVHHCAWARGAEGSTQGIVVLEALLAHGAPPNARDVDMRTPLHCAAYRGNTTVVRRLPTGSYDERPTQD